MTMVNKKPASFSNDAGFGYLGTEKIFGIISFCWVFQVRSPACGQHSGGKAQEQ